MENMRSEAKTAAMAYINETVEEAKMSANKGGETDCRADHPAGGDRDGD